MAYTKILVIHNRLDKAVDYAANEEKTSLTIAIDYALNRDKTEQTCFEDAINCKLETAVADMSATKLRWGKDRRTRKGYHIIQSFAPGEVTPEEAHAVGMAFANRLLGNRFEVVVGTHLNKAHLHNHIIFNSVSFMDGKMYRDTFTDYYGEQGIRGISDTICAEYGLSVIAPNTEAIREHKSRPEWAGNTTIRDTVRRDLDTAIARAQSIKAVWNELQAQGYAIKSGSNVMHTAVRIPGGKRFIRLDSLGDDYTTERIAQRLAAIRSGERPPAPPPPPVWASPGKRYHARRSTTTYKPKKLTGFRALYFKYLYLLGTIRKGRPRKRTALSLRQELIRFDRYQKQFLYLHHNRIQTPGQLAMQYDALQAKIDALTDRRCDLYRQKRREGDSEAVAEEIESITAALRPLRRDLKLCARIESDIPKIREAVHPERPPKQDRSNTHEKTDKIRPVRHSASRPGLSAGER